jgi:hypothetical protein
MGLPIQVEKKPPGLAGGFQDLVWRALSALHSCAGKGLEIKVPKIKADAIHGDYCSTVA